jgi:hypothetical protein
MEAFTSFFGILPPHCGKCWDVPVKPRIYKSSGIYSNIYMVHTDTSVCVGVRTCACVSVHSESRNKVTLEQSNVQLKL